MVGVSMIKITAAMTILATYNNKAYNNNNNNNKAYKSNKLQ